MSHRNLQPLTADGSTGIPAHPNSPGSGYTGPSTPWLLQHHKLVHQVIATHPFGPLGNILDDHELALLQRYVADSSSEATKRLLIERDMYDGDDFTGKRGEKVNQKYGSLVGYAIASGYFDEEEVKMLKGWFNDEELGLGKKLQGIRPSGQENSVAEDI